MKKKPERISRKKNKKRIQHQQLAIPNPNSETLFAIILAALYSSDNNSCSSQNSQLIKHCLTRLRRSLPQNISPPIISLLPILLNSKNDEIACKSAEFVGAASLISIEMNEMIASEDGIIMGLINLLASSRRSVSVAACNAILDLLTTSIGRQKLLKFSALEKLIVPFIQGHRSLPGVFSLFSNVNCSGNCLRIVFEEEDFTVLLLHATLVLINSCTTKQLQNIPSNVSKSFIIHLKRLWAEVHRMMLCGTSLKCSGERHFCVSNIRTNDLAESVFRLSIDNSQREGPSNIKEIMTSIFYLREVDFEQFILYYWEVSPLLIRGSSKDSLKQGNIFSCLAESFQTKEMPPFLPSMLKNLTSCPPIESDELNILRFLEEARDHFGCPIIYQQDIRVVKTHHSEGELHYSLRQSGSCSSQANFFNINDILKCEEAYNNGYTIALRGMEFRFESIAAIADGLASLFGQPSAGVNMYLTPPNSQGLSCHSDDHCVFVCQLVGVKEWNIFPRSSLQLPRLYESNGSWHDYETENQAMGGKKQFLLKEGDVLYIPRGFPHEARATIDEDGSGRFSLHLTLAIEVEPPFEWEGFIHVALNHWCEKQREPQRQFSDSLSWSLNITSVNMLHVAIKLIGDIDPTFRKASLVGQNSLSTVSEGWLTMNQKTMFKYLISRINTESKFSDSLEYLERAVEKHEDFFQQLRWLQHLTSEGDESHRSCISSADTRNILDLCSQHKDIVEAAFLQVKSKFCIEALFEDVEPNYKMLLERYKKVRKHYTKGMLSLHLTGDKM